MHPTLPYLKVSAAQRATAARGGRRAAVQPIDVEVDTHACSPRKGKKFVVVNLRAQPVEIQHGGEVVVVGP